MAYCIGCVVDDRRVKEAVWEGPGWKSPLTAAVCATTLLAVGGVGAQQAPPAAPPGQAPPGQGRAGGGGGGGRGGPGALFTLADADKDGAVTRAELKGVFDQFRGTLDKRFPAWNQASGALTAEQLAAGFNLVFPSPASSAGGGPQNQTPKPEDLVGDDGGASRQSAGQAGAARARCWFWAARRASSTRRSRSPRRPSKRSATRPKPGRRRSPTTPLTSMPRT